jgi:1-phosphofructokinase family hexose kinase
LTVVTVTLNTSVDRTIEVPRFAVGGHLKGRLVRVQAAGKGVNVARCLARLGVPSVVTGFVGIRELEFFREGIELSSRGLHARPPSRGFHTRGRVTGAEHAGEQPTLPRVGNPREEERVENPREEELSRNPREGDCFPTMDLVPVAEPTRTCTTILDPELGTDTHVREAGFHVRERELAALEAKLRSLASPETIVAFCGSLPPGVTARHLAALIAACQENGAQIAADLNGSELAVAIAGRALLIKPNVEELGEVIGRDLSSATEQELIRAARPLCDRVGTVLLTRGKEGALAVSETEALSGAVDVGTVRNTVGCGDAFLAGYLAGIWAGAAPEERLRQAVACGGANALANAAGEIDPRVVAELAAKARVRKA